MTDNDGGIVGLGGVLGVDLSPDVPPRIGEQASYIPPRIGERAYITNENEHSG